MAGIEAHTQEALREELRELTTAIAQGQAQVEGKRALSPESRNVTGELTLILELGVVIHDLQMCQGRLAELYRVFEDAGAIGLGSESWTFAQQVFNTQREAERAETLAWSVAREHFEEGAVRMVRNLEQAALKPLAEQKTGPEAAQQVRERVAWNGSAAAHA